MKVLPRHLLPDTLVGRTVLVLLVGLLLSQLAGIVLFTINRLELASALGSRQTAERIAGVVQLVEETPEADRGRVIHALDRPGLRVGWGRRPLLRGGEGAPEDLPVAIELLRRLPGREVHAEFRLPRSMPMMDPDEEGPAPGPGLRNNRPPLTLVSVRLEDGSWLNFVIPAQPPAPLWRPGFFAPLGGGLLVVTVLSVWAVRRASRPLASLAAAAERLGRDVGAPPMPVTGPREVRAAAVAFNRMQTRLKRFIDDRTQMVAAISHDLRTPITRLKLRAEFVDDEEQRLKMLADLDEMEAMIASTLAFARDDAAREPHLLIDLAELLKGLCDDFEVPYQGPEHVEVIAGAIWLKRAFANLLDNAKKYGGGARLSLTVEAEQVSVVVDDDGPGLATLELDRVFAPFYRVESSRNRATGGTGLGLTVARSAVRAHGGDIALGNRQGGGLRVAVTLPR